LASFDSRPKEALMKSHINRIRVIRRLALATGCIAAFAVPTGASAMIPDGRPQQSQAQQQQYTLPSNWRSEVQTTSPQVKAFVLHQGFRPEVSTQAPPAPVNQFALHKGFRPEVQTQSPATATAPSPAVIRQIETVTDNSGKTLAIVLASIALAIALCSLAYATIRVTQLQRREVQSH
jgi:hypothetical protein